MRTLKFIVNDQIIKKDPKCDFSNLIPGSEGHLKAEFSFSSEWDGCVKVASFWGSFGKEYPPQVLEKGRMCIIPKEALAKRSFKIQVVGKKDSLKLSTNKVEVLQNGGGS